MLVNDNTAEYTVFQEKNKLTKLSTMALLA